MRSRAVLSAGSNLGDRAAHLALVTEALAAETVALSGIVVTPPWGGVTQDDFYNLVVVAEADRTPEQWLELCHLLEKRADRVREVRWGPRTLDVDVVDVRIAGRPVLSDDPELTLPHPRAAERAFVLLPWLDAEPDARLWTADGPRPITELIDDLDPADVAGVQPLGPGSPAAGPR